MPRRYRAIARFTTGLDTEAKGERAQAESRTDKEPSRNALHTLPQRVEASRPPSGMIVVNVEHGTVGGVECEVVDGRELHVKLGNKDEFAHWIKDRIRQLKFVENHGFETFWGISQKGRPPREYRLTLVMAKKIAMAEHTDAGNAVRDYFLDRERISYEVPRQDSGMSRSEITSLVEDIIAQTIPAVVAAIAALPVATQPAHPPLRSQRPLKQKPFLDHLTHSVRSPMLLIRLSIPARVTHEQSSHQLTVSVRPAGRWRTLPD
jgi:phage anti-repressor protein